MIIDHLLITDNCPTQFALSKLGNPNFINLGGAGGGMFDSDDQNQNSSGSAVAGPADQPIASAPPVVTDNMGTQPDMVTSAPSAPTIADPMVTPSGQPIANVNGAPVDNIYTESPSQIGPAIPSQPADVPTAIPMTAATSDPSTLDPDLAQIKQQALQSLAPLVSQLDQAPDEKFKTVMMLIQASDNSKMLKDAYAAAGQITDERVRAQALLDIINEVNYFSQQQQ